MFSLFNPIVEAVIFSLLIGVYFYAHHSGYQERVDEDQAEIIRLNGQARAKEAELNTKIVQANSALKKAKDEAQNKQFSLNARADAGELRLPTSCTLQADSGSPVKSGNSANESESERQIVKDLIAIATDGDTAILSLNGCIKQYNEVRETVNKGVK